MDLFQDAAGRHAMELGIGFPDLAKKHQMWIVSGLQYQVVDSPKMYDTVRIVTWPLPAPSVTCRREYRMETLDGKVLVKGTSDWAIVDADKRKLLRAREVYPQGLSYCTDVSVEGKMPRLKEFESTTDGVTFTPGYAQLDMNGHVNNTKYANLILDALVLETEDTIKEFQIHYRKELLAYQPVTVYTQREGTTILAMGKNTDGELMFSGRIELE